MALTFGEMLRDLRRAAGFSQRELAREAGLDFSYISKVENNRIPPPAADTVVELCRVLKALPEPLLALSGKIPEKIQQNVSTSVAAQQFLQQAEILKLSDGEWKKLTSSIRRLRGKPR
jgi:HTH-type transcriptional regulator, competence development regulator